MLLLGFLYKEIPIHGVKLYYIIGNYLYCFKLKPHFHQLDG